MPYEEWLATVPVELTNDSLPPNAHLEDTLDV